MFLNHVLFRYSELTKSTLQPRPLTRGEFQSQSWPLLSGFFVFSALSVVADYGASRGSSPLSHVYTAGSAEKTSIDRTHIIFVREHMLLLPLGGTAYVPRFGHRVRTPGLTPSFSLT